MLYLQESLIICPYCGETLDILVDGLAGEQSYYEDCSVCCSPILVLLTEDDSGALHIEAKRDDE